MKHLKNLLLFILLISGLSVFSQKEIKEGVIKTKVSMSSENEQVNASLASMGEMFTITYFNNTKSRTEMSSPMTGKSTTIVDNEKGEILMLMENPMIGNKFQKSTYNTSKVDEENIKITETGDSKNILGYPCKGYEIVLNENGNEVKMKMYVTEKIAAPTQQSLKLSKKIKGYPLHMTMDVNQNGMPITTVMEVTEIKPEKVDPKMFNMKIPEGFSELPQMK